MGFSGVFCYSNMAYMGDLWGPNIIFFHGVQNLNSRNMFQHGIFSLYLSFPPAPLSSAEISAVSWFLYLFYMINAMVFSSSAGKCRRCLYVWHTVALSVSKLPVVCVFVCTCACMTIMLWVLVPFTSLLVMLCRWSCGVTAWDKRIKKIHRCPGCALVCYLIFLIFLREQACDLCL